MSSTKSLVDFEYTQTQESQQQIQKEFYSKSHLDVNHCSNIKYVGKKQNTEVKLATGMPPSQEVTMLKAEQSVSFELSTAKCTKQEQKTQTKLIEHLRDNFGICSLETNRRVHMIQKTDFESALAEIFKSLTPLEISQMASFHASKLTALKT